MLRQQLARGRAAHGISVDVGSPNPQMIHQLDGVFGRPGAVRLGFVAQAMIAIVQRDHAMVGVPLLKNVRSARP